MQCALLPSAKFNTQTPLWCFAHDMTELFGFRIVFYCIVGGAFVCIEFLVLTSASSVSFFFPYTHAHTHIHTNKKYLMYTSTQPIHSWSNLLSVMTYVSIVHQNRGFSFVKIRFFSSQLIVVSVLRQ